METLDEYIKANKDFLKRLSDTTYGVDDGRYKYRDDNIYYFNDFNDYTREICFARFYKQFMGRKICASYILKLPYKKSEKLANLDNVFMNYTNIFNEMKETVSSVYNMEVNKTGFKNIKIITFYKKLKDLPYSLDYSLTLILFCLLRGMDTEYANIWESSTYKDRKIPQTLEEYFYEYSIRTGGSNGHDINDNIANTFGQKRYTESGLRDIAVFNFVNVLKKTFGINGKVNDDKYYKYWKDVFINEGKYGNYAMQTDCFNFIEQTTNRIILEERL